MKEKSVKENAVISYDEEGMQAILDDKVIDRQKDSINYAFRISQQYKEWKGILNDRGSAFTQKGIVDFLKRREEGELEGIENLLASLQNFKYVTNISGDAGYEDGNNYTFAIKVNDVEGSTTLPRVIFPEIEIFNESGFTQMMEVEIEIIKPKNSEEKLTFRLSCPKIDRYVKAAVDFEVERLKKELDGYLIITGKIY